MVEDQLNNFGEVKVSEIMVKNPLYTTPNEKISTTELLMLRKNIGGLPVVKNSTKKQLVGIITQRDIRLARFAMSLESPNKTVKDLMTPEPFIVKKDTTIKQALTLMFDKNIERLPVVNENNELIGLLLQTNILKSLLEHLKL
ncbi:MAG: CBS domain-containing protein [Candidatus Hodarchaeota archaeon]